MEGSKTTAKENAGTGRPEERLTVSGETMMGSQLEKVLLTTVKCDAAGAPLDLGPEQQEEYSHIKTTFRSFYLQESRRDPSEGTWQTSAVQLADKKKEQVAALTMRINEQDLDVLEGGSWEVVFPKSMATLPAKALLSMQYKSVCGDTRFVCDHPITLVFASGKEANGCCVVM